MTLEQYRVANGLTFLHLADAIGIVGEGRARTAQRYARGERFPDPEMLLRIREATSGAVMADDFVDQHTAPTVALPPSERVPATTRPETEAA